LRTQSTRVAPLATSLASVNVDAQAKRISPPASIDCSGSHWRTVPCTVIVFTLASASAPPTAWTARFTRSWP